MEIIEKLPDDIIVHIYTKVLKKYRLHDGKFIKRIDIEKYKFLEKYIYRKIINISTSNFTIEMKCKLNNFSELSNRKKLFIDDDMMYVYITFKENMVKYYIQHFRLKNIEDIDTKIQSIYYKGNYIDYDWKVFSYTYEL